MSQQHCPSGKNMINCGCSGWAKSSDQVFAAQQMAELHGINYTGETFRFCPWCGKKMGSVCSKKRLIYDGFLAFFMLFAFTVLLVILPVEVFMNRNYVGIVIWYGLIFVFFTIASLFVLFLKWLDTKIEKWYASTF